jgi:hypothetical protein
VSIIKIMAAACAEVEGVELSNDICRARTNLDEAIDYLQDVLDNPYSKKKWMYEQVCEAMNLLKEEL